MVTLHGKHDPLRLMGRRLLLLALALLVVSAAWEVWSVYNKDKESAQLNAQSQAQLSDLQTRETKLQGDLANLQTERGMEAALRQQYAVGDQGEGLIVIVEPQKPAPVEATSSMMQWFKDVLSHL